jgi:hypothetical protein
MAMIKTGNPVPATPTEKVQGYLDCMADKDPQNQNSEIYMSGYLLAKKVKAGEEKAPVWAT